MESFEDLKKQIATTRDLQSLVKTMKALAATNIRQYEQAVESLAEYHQTVALGMYIACNMQPEVAIPATPTHPRRIGAIVFGTDQGLCGPINEQIAEYALKVLGNGHPSPTSHSIIAVGTRVTGQFVDAGRQVEESLQTPSSRIGITVLAQDILIKIEEWQNQADMDRIVLCYHRHSPSTGITPHTFQLLPLDWTWFKNQEQPFWSSQRFPLVTMGRNRLLAQLIRQYLFVALCRALAQSLSSESMSRLASMQRAERNISQHFEELQTQFYQQRQTSITEELLDLIGGFESLARHLHRPPALFKPAP